MRFYCLHELVHHAKLQSHRRIYPYGQHIYISVCQKIFFIETACSFKYHFRKSQNMPASLRIFENLVIIYISDFIIVKAYCHFNTDNPFLFKRPYRRISHLQPVLVDGTHQSRTYLAVAFDIMEFEIPHSHHGSGHTNRCEFVQHTVKYRFIRYLIRHPESQSLNRQYLFALKSLPRFLETLHYAT